MTEALSSLMEQDTAKLDACVHCGFCLPACPTWSRLGDEADSPRGRLHLMRAVHEGRLDPGADAFQTHIDRCLGCRACETVCPSGVEYGLLLEEARVAALSARPAPLLTRALLRTFASPWMSRALMVGGAVLRATGLPALAARTLPASPLRTALAMLAGSAPADLALRAEGVGSKGTVWTAARGAQKGPRPGWEELDPDRPRDASAEHSGPSPQDLRYAGMLEGCVQRGLFGRVNRATRRVLEANGVRVMPVAGQGCCGALHAHAGDATEARRLARRTIEAFERAGVEWVVVNAAGCGSAMKEYAHLLAGDPEWSARARAFSGRVRDVTEMMAELGPRRGAMVDLKVSYDAPCHLEHAQRVPEAPLSMLNAVPGLTVVPLQRADECCGGAGIYGLTHPELGDRIGSDKVDDVMDAGASVVCTGNPGCMMQIGAGLRMRGSRIGVAHPVEVLDLSYARAGFYTGKDA